MASSADLTTKHRGKIDQRLFRSLIAITVGLLFLLSLMPPGTLALGIRPARTSLSLEETPAFNGTIWVVNNDQQDFTALIGVEGELSPYVTVQSSELHFTKDVPYLPAQFAVVLPKHLRPGESTGFIVVSQELDDQEEGVISTSVALKHRVVAMGPYPDKYIETKLNFHENGEVLRFVSEVRNLGKKNIEAVQTTFYVGNDDNASSVLMTEENSLDKGKSTLLEAAMNRSELSVGEYDVKAVTEYDDLQVELTKKLWVGKPEVDITYFDRYFRAWEINPYSLDLLNKWNQKIENVFVDISVKKNETEIDAFRTKSVDINALMTRRINDYLDARDRGEGVYSFDMVVNFWDTYRMTSKRFSAELLSAEDFSQVNASNLAGAAVAEGMGNVFLKEWLASPWAWMMLGTIVVLSIYVLWRYLHREEYDGGEESLL